MIHKIGKKYLWLEPVQKTSDFDRLVKFEGKWYLAYSPEEKDWERHKLIDKVNPSQYQWITISERVIFRKCKTN
jgi:hypothetical protein